MSISVTYTSTIQVVDTSPDTFVSASDNTLTYGGMSSTQSLNAGSQAPVTKHAAFEIALTAGAATIDLTALVGAMGAAVTGSGLKVQVVKFRNKATNANAMTLSEGASNGYELFGNAWSVSLPVGGEITAYLNEGAPDIGGSAKTIDVAGTGSQVLQVHIVMG